MPRYPIVLFDVGQTLVGPAESYGAVYYRVLVDLGVEVESVALERAIREVTAEMARRIPPGRDRFAHFGGESGFWSRFVCDVLERATGRVADDRFARRALDSLWDAFGRPSAWRVFDDVLPTLDQLRRSGTRLGVVSNWDSRLPRLLELLDLGDYFETLAVSHIEGVEKPDAALFRRALERLDARPDQALHVGDVKELDVVGARAAGIDGILLDRQGREADDVVTIRDLRELPPIAAAGLDAGL
jgi:putative hydrolase of the HAD superfamily